MKTFLPALFFICIAIADSSKGQPLLAENCDNIKKEKFKTMKLKICDKILDVEVADSDWSRAIGLMCRDNMPESSGMIFVFSEERELSFWMKNTRIPLTIGYFDKNKTLIDTYDMKPLDETKSYPSKKKSLYALETNLGWYKKNKVAPGCKFELLK